MNISPIERETMALLPCTRQQLAALLDITNSAACQRVQDLAARGFVTGARGPVALTPAGAEALRACPAPFVLPEPLADDALPCRVVASQTGVRLLRHLVEEIRDGRRPTHKTASDALGVCVSAITTLVASLTTSGLVEVDASLSTRQRRVMPTELGVAVADGRVPVVSHQLVRAERRFGRHIETSAPAAARAPKPRRPVADIRAAVARVAERVAPPPPPPVAARPAEPVDVGPPVPPGLDVNAPARTVRHPAPPGPGVRDASRYSAPYWERITNAPHSGLHTACQRGIA